MPRPPNPSNELWIGEKSFKMPFPLVNMYEPPGLSAEIKGCSVHGPCGPGGIPRQPAKGAENSVDRLRWRRPVLADPKLRTHAFAQKYVRQFVVHLDGLFDAVQCFDVLQNERGLSCHFILDNDGTWYQTANLADCCYHASGMNETSIGVEICSRGEANGPTGEASALEYTRRGIIRPAVVCEIHGEKYVAFSFTKEQDIAMAQMAKELTRLLPAIKLDYPKTTTGEPSRTLIFPDDPANIRLRDVYSGYLGHYHANIQKWDPGPFDFKKLVSSMAGRFVFPIGLHKFGDKAEVPEEKNKVEDFVQAYYDNNEQEAPGGYFPVGPLEGYRLWHSGVHFRVPEGEKVYSPFAGQVIAARNGPPNSMIGSTNFVLIEHAQQVGSENVKFYALYMHLKEEVPGKKKNPRPKWMSGEGWKGEEPGRVWVLKPRQVVQAGEVIGQVGLAGPDFESQLHFEIFATDHGPVDRLDKTAWDLVSGTVDRRFCTHKDIVPAIDKNGNKQIDREELMNFFHDDPDRIRMHRMVTYHYSEWTELPDWKQDIKEAKELKLKPAELDQLVDEQITPTMWWTPQLASELQLPSDGRIYTYHPIGFLAWMNKLLRSKSKADEDAQIRGATAEDMKFRHAKGKGAMSDLDDTTGASFATVEDRSEKEIGVKLELEDLIDGYGD